jgi:hypothetical protein
MTHHTATGRRPQTDAQWAAEFDRIRAISAFEVIDVLVDAAGVDGVGALSALAAEWELAETFAALIRERRTDAPDTVTDWQREWFEENAPRMN